MSTYNIDDDCPPDALEPNGTLCNDVDVCTDPDACQSGVCVGTSLCGNGVLDGACGEECDDGNTASEDGCSSACLDEFCGDGVVQAGLGEQCDDGGTTPGDGCDEFYQLEVILLGEHKCVLDGNSQFTLTTSALPLPAFPLVGALDVDCGGVDAGTGKASCTCELQSLDPVLLICSTRRKPLPRMGQVSR